MHLRALIAEQKRGDFLLLEIEFSKLQSFWWFFWLSTERRRRSKQQKNSHDNSHMNFKFLCRSPRLLMFYAFNRERKSSFRCNHPAPGSSRLHTEVNKHERSCWLVPESEKSRQQRKWPCFDFPNGTKLLHKPIAIHRLANRFSLLTKRRANIQIFLHLSLPTTFFSCFSLRRQEAIERKIKIYRIVYCLEMSGRRDRSTHSQSLFAVAPVWFSMLQSGSQQLPNSSFTYELGGWKTPGKVEMSFQSDGFLGTRDGFFARHPRPDSWRRRICCSPIERGSRGGARTRSRRRKKKCQEKYENELWGMMAASSMLFRLPCEKMLERIMETINGLKKSRKLFNFALHSDELREKSSEMFEVELHMEHKERQTCVVLEGDKSDFESFSYNFM